MSKQLPFNDYYEYFAPDYELDVRPSNMENANSHDYLHKIKSAVIDNIRRTGKPSVEAFTNIPDAPPNLYRAADSDAEDEEEDLDADENKDVRKTQLSQDKQIAHDGEMYDESDDEDYKNSLGVRAQPGTKKKRNITDFPNPNAAPADDLDGMEEINGESAVSTRQASAAVKSRTQTPATGEQEADEDGDINMDAPPAAPAPADDSAQSQSPAGGVVTPPESPPTAPTAMAPTSAPTADVEMEGNDDKEEIAASKEEGQAERDSENVKGEVRTEVAKD
jgi:histone deacetylase 1/2